MTIHHNSRILVVDDSVAVRNILRKLLLQLGFKEIDEATDGTEALTKIMAVRYDLVISDWNMAKMDGEALLEAVRSNEKYKRIAFLMMTSEARAEKVVQASQAGVSGFIIKPFGAAALMAKISQINAAIELRA